MSELGHVLVLVLGLVAIIGLVTFATSFKRPAVSSRALPQAQIVEGATSPLAGSRLHVSATRIAIGIVLMVVGAGGVMFIYAAAGLASLANH